MVDLMNSLIPLYPPPIDGYARLLAKEWLRTRQPRPGTPLPSAIHIAPRTSSPSVYAAQISFFMHLGKLLITRFLGVENEPKKAVQKEKIYIPYK